MQLFYTDEFQLPLPEGHPFPAAKYRRLRERLMSADWASECAFIVPSAATDEQLATAHSEAYLHGVIEGTLTAKEIRRIGFPWSAALVERSRRSTGATIAASELGDTDLVWLQAGDDVAGFYERLGFVTVDRSEVWIGGHV